MKTLWILEAEVQLLGTVQADQGPDIMKRIKVSRLRWVGHVKRIHEDDITRKTLFVSASEEDQE